MTENIKTIDSEIDKSEKIRINTIIDSHIDLFGSMDNIITKLGFSNEKDMLSKLNTLEEPKLNEIIIKTLKFPYEKDELIKIIFYIYRKIFD